MATEKHTVDHPSAEPSREPRRSFEGMLEDSSPVKTRLAPVPEKPFVPMTVAEHNAWVDRKSAELLKEQ